MLKIALLAAILAAASSCQAAAAAPAKDDDVCYARAVAMPHKPLPGLKIDEVRRRDAYLLSYTGRYRDSSFRLDNAACEQTQVLELTVIVPQGSDPWARLEALRSAFRLHAPPLSERQKVELQTKGELGPRDGEQRVAYAYRGGDLEIVVSLTIETPI